MRVLSVSQTHPDPVNPQWGTFIRRSLLSLVAADVDIEAISPRPLVPPIRLPAPFERFRHVPPTYEYGYPVHYPRYPYLLPKFPLYGLSGILYRRVVSKYVLKHCRRASVVHAQFEFPDGYGMIPIADAWECPLVLSSRGEILQLHARGRLWSPLVRKTIRRADAICAVSRHQARLAARFVDDPRKVVLIPNGIDIDRFRMRDRNWRMPVTFLFVGRLNRRKGVDILLDSFLRAILQYGAIRLRVVGDGPLQGWMMKRTRKLNLASRVSYLGSIDEGSLIEEYSAAHALVLPSRGEGRPNVVYEAMACELPVVASNVGGVAEQVEQGVTGLLIPPENPRELANAIIHIAEDLPGARRMGEQGRVRVLREGWTWDAHVSRLRSVYENVIAGKPP